MELVVTIDAEEDQWSPSTRISSVTNVQEVRSLEPLFASHGVIPTYLLTYPVAQDERASSLLRDVLETGRCEIGMHCHPWNTPPYREPITRYNSMLCNLPSSLQWEKLQRLHELLVRRFGRPPLAFRSGRWGFGRETAGMLTRLGCRVDTSVTPYTSWAASGGPDFSSYSPHPFAFTADRLGQNSASDMLEIPVTIGYLGGGSFTRCHQWRKVLSKPLFRRLRLAGMLSNAGLIRSVWLSPERETPARLIRLLRQAQREGCELVNLFFHTSSLKVGCTPFVRTSQEKQRFLRSLISVLEYCQAADIRRVPLSQAVRRVARSQAIEWAFDRVESVGERS